jgi:antitoxin MazE
MQTIHTKLQKVGNSRGVLIPKPLLVQAGLTLSTGVDITLDGETIVLRKPARPVREGWAQAAAQVAQAKDDELLLGEFDNAADVDWQW